jgi:hypothetical protein
VSVVDRSRARVAALTLAALVAVTLTAVVLAVAVVAPHAAATPHASAELERGSAPWPPETRFLRARVTALGLPVQSDAAFHIHALLRIYVDGRPVAVPAQLGINAPSGFIAPLHTHDATGIIHVEADRPYPFTLGQVFAVWGVRFGKRTLGGYVDAGARRLRVYADGRRIADPVAYVLRAHDHIVVSFGAAGAAPRTDHTPFPAGL